LKVSGRDSFTVRFAQNEVVCIVATARSVVLLLSAALAGCATAPATHAVSQWEATSNLRPTTVSDAYIDQHDSPWLPSQMKKAPGRATFLARAFDPGAGGASALG
jgi:hypothetical protein